MSTEDFWVEWVLLQTYLQLCQNCTTSVWIQEIIFQLFFWIIHYWISLLSLVSVINEDFDLLYLFPSKKISHFALICTNKMILLSRLTITCCKFTYLSFFRIYTHKGFLIYKDQWLVENSSYNSIYFVWNLQISNPIIDFVFGGLFLKSAVFIDLCRCYFFVWLLDIVMKFLHTSYFNY